MNPNRAFFIFQKNTYETNYILFSHSHVKEITGCLKAEHKTSYEVRGVSLFHKGAINVCSHENQNSSLHCKKINNAPGIHYLRRQY